MFAKIETERLLFIWLNKIKLRSEKYIHLRKTEANDGNMNLNALGKMIILPVTFTRSQRHMHEYAQDAMTYVREYGRPNLFITFTCVGKRSNLFVYAPKGKTKNIIYPKTLQ